MLHQDIFTRVGGVEHSLEDLFHHQHALEHAARRCHQPGGKVSIHKVQNQKNRNVEHENIASLHGHNISAPTNHPTFDPKAKLHVKRGLRRSVRSASTPGSPRPARAPTEPTAARDGRNVAAPLFFALFAT